MEKIKKFISRRLIVILFFVLAGAVFLISARGEYLQYKEIGEQYVSIFFKNLRTKYIVFFVAFICSYLIIFVSNKIVRRSLKDIFDKEGKNMPRLPNKSISFIVSVIVAVIAESVFTEKFLLFTNVAQAQFGTYDPIFKLDISFYMFQLPFIKSVILFFIVYMVILTLYIAVYYIATINICLDGVDMEDLKKNRFIKQLFTNIFIVAALIAGLMVLGSQEIVTGNMITLNDEARTELVGAGLTEVKIKVIGYRILGVVIFFSLFRTVKYLKKFKVKKIISSMLITPIYLVMLFGVMTGFQYIYANRNEFDKQKEYIKENIKNTRQAYNIAIDEVDVDNSAELDNETILKNTEVLSQITIVDEDTTLANLAEYKDNDGYYTYQTTKIGRYSINGKNRSLYITPREIISGANRTYNNKTYQYTHGYGVVISEATRVDDKTDNILYVQSKYTNEEDKIAIKEPRIYFGMATEDTVVTNVKNKKEFDYPTSTTSYEENEYDGEAGIKANLIDRAVLSLTEQDYKLLFNTSITKDSKILMNRNIRERAKVLLPYLLYDEEPYMVIREDGQLVWVLDAYTVSNSYPFSQKTNIEFEGKYKEILGLEKFDKVINIDQSPIGRTPRSNPATYTNVFTDIRELFAKTMDAKERGYNSGRFSFNVSGGRCENCSGAGINKIEMFFLPDVYVTCDTCHGKRYNRETLEVKYKGKSISDVLDMTIAESVDFFENIPKIRNKLQTLYDVGLGYIKLGQPATELSGGEAQRVKLATELSKRATGKSLYILDEPTTGLHSDDIKKLLVILNRIVDNGDTVIVIEHNLDVIKVADHIIDLGPEGGDQGGTIVATGTPEAIAKVEESYTGQFLKKYL